MPHLVVGGHICTIISFKLLKRNFLIPHMRSYFGKLEEPECGGIWPEVAGKSHPIL